MDYATTPEKGTVNYYYMTNGLLDHKTDAKSQTLWYGYDSHNRLLTISSGASQGSATVLTTFTYDTATNGVRKMATAKNCNSLAQAATLGRTGSTLWAV